MEEKPQSELPIVRIARLWDRRPAVDEVWVVTFDMLEREGRYECIGFALKSYGEDDLPWLPDRDVQVIREGGLSPRPLRSTQVGALPFGGLLASARKENSEHLGGVLSKLRELFQEAESVSLPDGAPLFTADQIRTVHASLQATTLEISEVAGRPAQVERPLKRRGRPPDWTEVELLRVARVYAKAFLSDTASPRPVAAVVEQLGYTPDRAKKLIRACRKQGFLGKDVERGTPGGLGPAATVAAAELAAESAARSIAAAREAAAGDTAAFSAIMQRAVEDMLSSEPRQVDTAADGDAADQPGHDDPENDMGGAHG
jgi:hypothetical protein